MPIIKWSNCKNLKVVRTTDRSGLGFMKVHPDSPDTLYIGSNVKGLATFLSLIKTYKENKDLLILEYGLDFADVLSYFVDNKFSQLEAGESLYACGTPCSAEFLISLFLDFRVREQKFISDLMEGEDKDD